MPRDIAYNQAQATVVVNGLLVDNLADGDSIRIINDAVGAQKTVGTHSTMISFASDGMGGPCDRCGRGKEKWSLTSW